MNRSNVEKVQATLGVGSKETCQPQGGVNSDRPLPCADCIDTAPGNTYRFGQTGTTDVERLEKILEDDFAGILRGKITFARC